MNRRGVLLLTADQDVKLDPRELQVWGEGTLADGTVLRRRARGSGHGRSMSRARPRKASWTGSGRSPRRGWGSICRWRWRRRRPRLSKCSRRASSRWRRACATSTRASGRCAARATPPELVNVDVNGAKDLRVIDMKTGHARDDRHVRRHHHQGHRSRRATTCTSAAGCAPTMATRSSSRGRFRLK